MINQKRTQGGEGRQYPLPRRHRAMRAAAALALMLLSAAAFQGVAAGGERVSFSDLKEGHWAYPAILELSTEGILAGFPDGSFRPEKPVTYGEWIKLVVLLSQPPLESAESETEREDRRYYMRALEKGLVSRVTVPETKLTWPVPRGDMALILDQESSVTGSRQVAYEEVAKAMADVKPGNDRDQAMIRGFFLGLYKGYPDGTFRTDAVMSRAEAAIVLSRALTLQKKKDVMPRQAGPEEPSDRTYPITDFVSNIEEYQQERWLGTDRVRLLTPREAGLRVRSLFNGRGAGYDHTMEGWIYTVQKGRIIEACQSMPYPGFVSTVVSIPLEEIDAILCVPWASAGQQTMLLVRQPFVQEEER